jgi:hypothetical protein
MRLALLALAGVAALGVAALALQSDDGAGGGRPARPAVIALLGDDIDERTGRLEGPHATRVMRVSLPGGAILAQRTLGRRFEDPHVGPRQRVVLTTLGSLLATTPDGQTVLALVRQPPGGRDFVAELDAASLETRRRHPLPGGVSYDGLRLGRSGRIYAYGVRPDRGGAAPVVTILDAVGTVIASAAVPGRTGRDWRMHWAAIAPDERRLVLSYHGGNTTGADWVDPSRDALHRCPSRRRSRACAFEVHGAVEPFGRGFLATTGDRVIELGRDGRVIRRLRLRPRNIHLMDFALDTARERLYLSSCGRRPVIQRLDLARDRLETLPSGRYCGAPLAVGAGFLVLAGARVDSAGYTAGGPAGLRLIDLARPGAGVPVPLAGRPLDAVVVG